MFSKNTYLMMAILMFVLLAIIYFENMTMGASGIVFLWDTSGSAYVSDYLWPIALISGLAGASIVIYIQKLMDEMSMDEQTGGLNI